MMVQSKVLQIESVESSWIKAQFEQVYAMLSDLTEKVEPKPPKEEYLTQGETANLLKVHRVTVSEWDKAGVISGLRIGRKIRYKKSEVLEAMQIINKRKASA